MRARYLLILLVLILAIEITAIVAVAQGPWSLVGSSRFTSGGIQHGVITVTNKIPFSVIRFKADRAPARVDRVLITYKNGRTQMIQMMTRLRQDAQSRIIRLRGQDRYIDTIQLWGRSVSPRDIDTKVLVYAR